MTAWLVYGYLGYAAGSLVCLAARVAVAEMRDRTPNQRKHT